MIEIKKKRNNTLYIDSKIAVFSLVVSFVLVGGLLLFHVAQNPKQYAITGYINK